MTVPAASASMTPAQLPLPHASAGLPPATKSSPSLLHQLAIGAAEFFRALTRGFGIIPAPADPRVNLNSYGPRTNFRWASVGVMKEVIRDWPQETIKRGVVAIRGDVDLKASLLRNDSTGPLKRALAEFFKARCGSAFARFMADSAGELEGRYRRERQQWMEQNRGASPLSFRLSEGLRADLEKRTGDALAAGGLRTVLDDPQMVVVLKELFDHFCALFGDPAFAHKAVFNGVFLGAMGRASTDQLAAEILKFIQAQAVTLYETARDPQPFVRQIQALYTPIQAQDFLRSDALRGNNHSSLT